MAVTPDVSVIIAVYNTMPYLRACLASLTTQTLGLDRVEIILVDDGSTDGSEVLVDEFAAAHTDSVTVIHQANSGTPAAPFNRGMEVATGRYLFFLGSDDYLGDEALERLVRAADDWESDVVFGKNVGVNGHPVNTRVFSQGTVVDLDLFASALPYGLSNSKLFRRELIESLGLRYREDIRSRCDQPFTLTAIVHGKRVSVLTDYDYYYGVKRADESNVTFTADPAQVLRSAAVIMDTIAELIEAGPRRDFVMKRQFHLEVSSLVGAAFLDFDESTQRRVIEGVAALADSYLTDNLRRSLTVRPRVQLVLAQLRDLGGLIEANRAMKAFSDGGRLALVADGGRLFARYPGFGEGRTPDENFEIFDELITRRVARGLHTSTTIQSAEEIVINADLDIIGIAASMLRAEVVPIAGNSAAYAARVAKRSPGEALPLILVPGPDSTGVTVTVPTVVFAGRGPACWSMRLRVELRGNTYDVPFPAPAGIGSSRAGNHGRSGHLNTGHLNAQTGPDGRLVFSRATRWNIRSVVAAQKHALKHALKRG